MVDVNPNISNERDLSLQEVLEELWRRKWTVLFTTMAFTVIVGTIAFIVPKKYEADAIVMPVQSSSSGSQGMLGSLASQFGGLASLAGISGNVDPKVSESIAVLKSEALTERYIQANNLLPVLYPNLWDAQTKRWKTSDPKKMPTLWKANQFFKGRVRAVVSDQKTGLVTVSITWTDPVVAAKWANDLVRLTNEYQRDKAIRESERNIAYLTEQGAKTSVVEARQAIYSLMETEINKSMVARGNDEYAVRIIDPAVAPERPSSPQKLIWLILGTLGGLFVGVSAVLIRWSWKSAHSSTQRS